MATSCAVGKQARWTGLRAEWGKRHRALLLLGCAGAFRRAELVALEAADLAFEDEGLRIVAVLSTPSHFSVRALMSML